MSIRKGGALVAGTSGGVLNKNTATGATNPIYDWFGTYDEWVDQNVATAHPEWLCYITDDGGSSPSRTNPAPYNVGDFFYTMRTDNELNGAVECDGSTYSTTDFTGAQSIGALLEAGKLDYVSLSAYSTAISTKGWCDKIGWDGTGTTSFRVPTLTPHIIQKNNIPVVGNGKSLGLTDGSQEVGLSQSSYSFRHMSASTNGVNVAVGTAVNDDPFSQSSKAVGIIADGTKSGIIADTSDTAQLRVMIQLATGATDRALMVCSTVSGDVENIKAHAVVEFQAPTAANNYTWYRKYADGWVEQGGLDGGSTQGGVSDRRVNIPITMSDANYYVNCQKTSGWDGSGLSIQVGARDTTGFSWSITYSGSAQNRNICWEIKGMAA